MFWHKHHSRGKPGATAGLILPPIAPAGIFVLSTAGR